MTENWLKTITDSQARQDGQAVTMTLHTVSSEPLQIHLNNKQIESLLIHLINLAKAAGSCIPSSSPAAENVGVVPIPADQLSAVVTPDGELVMSFRLGTVDLSFAVPKSNFAALGRVISELAMKMPSTSSPLQ